MSKQGTIHGGKASLRRDVTGLSCGALALLALGAGDALAGSDGSILDELSCDMHFFALSPGERGSFVRDGVPYATVRLRANTAGVVWYETGSGFVTTARGESFPNAPEIMRDLANAPNTPPVWREYLDRAAEESAIAEARVHVTSGQRWVTDVVVPIPERDADAQISAGALTGVSRIPRNDGDGWLYAMLWATGCFDPG